MLCLLHNDKFSSTDALKVASLVAMMTGTDLKLTHFVSSEMYSYAGTAPWTYSCWQQTLSLCGHC
jgi:hypothetical protein